MTPWPFLVIAGVLGAAIGSFLNVVVYRVPRGESLLFPSSHCPACDVEIKRRHNVPLLGWLVLRGRCAGCAGHISARYPLVEAATALVYVAVTVQFGLSPALPAFLFLATVAITLALIDLDGHRMPASIVVPSYVIGVLLLTLATVPGGDWHPLVRAVGGAAALVVLALGVTIQLPFGGVGRIELAGLLGLFLGWLSWSAVFVGAVGMLVLCAVAGTGRSLTKQQRSPLTIPLAPPMVMAAGAALFVTTPLVHWYGSLMGMA